MCDMLGLEEHEFSDDLLTQLNQAIADTFPVFETRALNLMNSVLPIARWVADRLFP